MATDPLLDHLERTFAEAYRKELDQEENIWRSLPFFAATLALQLTAVTQIRDWIAAIGGPLFVAAVTLLAVAGVSALAALAFLALSIWPADFRRVAREPAFRDYAEDVRAAVDRTAQPGTTAQDIADQALVTVKAALAEQYSLAADNNRMVNETRALWRARAGLAMLGSVFAALVLVAIVVVTNIHDHGKDRSEPTGRKGQGAAAVRDFESAPTEQRPAPADDRAAQGMGHRPHDGASGTGAGARRP
jgi:hypothetical protein